MKQIQIEIIKDKNAITSKKTLLVLYQKCLQQQQLWDDSSSSFCS
jgi:hypothetical protein